jgi:hypothetical protein
MNSKARMWNEEVQEFNDITGPRIIHHCDGTFSIEAPMDCVIEWFTGVLDKNGKEIYQGDYLRDKYGNIGLCYYVPSTWVFLDHGGHITDGSPWEVIGNIHENREIILS